MKRKIALIIMLALMLCLFTGCSGTAQSEPEQTITIGMFEPLTGENGVGGRQEALGIIYANMVQPTVEIGGVTYKVELAVGDNESSQQKALTAAQNLVAKNVVAVIGSHTSDESLAASDIFEAAGIPVLGACCTNPGITVGNEHYFRICWLDTFQGAVLANFADDYLGAGKVYCLSQLEDNYSAGLCGEFIKDYTAMGGTVVYESFHEGTTDFTPYIRAAQREGAQAFFAPVTTESAIWLVSQAAEQGLNIPIMAGDSFDSTVIAAAAKNVKSNVYLTTFFDESTDTEKGREFVKGFQKFVDVSDDIRDFNGGSDMVAAASAMGYDAYFVLLEAMKNAGSTEPADIMAALGDVNYEGVTGLIAFDEHGDAIRSEAYIKQLDKANSDWEFVKVQTLGETE